MIQQQKKLREFYKNLIAKEKISAQKALKIFEALHREAVHLGAFNAKNILDGLEVDLRIARAINRLT